MGKIYQYITDNDINSNYKITGIDQPLTEVLTEDLSEIIKSKIDTLEAKNGLHWLAYFNLRCQRIWIEESHRISTQELNALGVLKKNVEESRMLLHRDMFLYVIGELIVGNHNGEILSRQYNMSFLGQPEIVEIFVLVNVWFSRITMKDTRYLQLLRNNPSSYDQQGTADYYFRWIVRYQHIYTQTLESLDEKNKHIIKDGVKLLEEDMKISLAKYFQELFNIWEKFLLIPSILNKNPNLKKENIQPGGTSIFDFNRGRRSLEEDPLLMLFESKSGDLSEMKDFLEMAVNEDKQKDRDFDPIFKYAIKLFHRPVYKESEGRYHIMDLKFLIEGGCSGLLWRLYSLLENATREFKLKDLTCQYGLLLDAYFKEFIKKIFCAKSEVGENKPDAVVRSATMGTVIFEFTTEYYTIESLYSFKIDKARAKLDTILFNEGGRKNKQKRSPGKFINLNKYIKNEREINPKSKIIPIVVTEKYLGDVSLIEESGYNIKQKIEDLNLEQLQENPPMIISLDELEIFWRYIPNDKENTINLFIDCINKWRNEKDKAQYEFSLGHFLMEELKNCAVNKKYEEFFNPTNIQSR